jgi:hypothetical protein
MSEKDLLDDLLTDENDDDGEGTGKESDEAKALKEELAALKKENHGLLTTVKKERGKRQNSDGRLEQLTATVNGIIEQNKSGAADLPTKAEADDGLRVLYNDDGEPYLPTESLNTLLSQQQQEINQLKEALQITASQSTAVAEAEKAKMAIVGKDESYGPAYTKYQTARRWVENAVDQWQHETGNVGKQVGSGYALDHIFDASLREQFNAEFPDMDIFTIVTAEDGLGHFERTLQSLAPKADETTELKKPDSRFKQVMDKPSSLGKTANAKTEPSIFERAGNLSATDIGELSDAQVAALEKAMRSEENDGITF